MSQKLPTELKWGRFRCVLTRLGYESFPSAGGSARSFHRNGNPPTTITFHQPHGFDTIRQGTLTAYLRHLQIARDEFFSHLEQC